MRKPEGPNPDIGSLVSVGTVCFFDYARAARQAHRNTELLPGSLVTVTSPPIMRANLQVIASPPRLGRGVIISRTRPGGGKNYLAPLRNA